MLNKLLGITAVFIVLQLLVSFTGVDSLQCYNCRGITNYDPNECFIPTAKTIVQECRANEVCEKRVTMVDRLQDVIDRGCSANCANREFIWTDEYQVYCCKDKNKCNTASGPIQPIRFMAIAAATTLMVFFTLTLTIFG